MTEQSPKGCDTFIAYPPTTANGHVIFGKNSDRPAGEGQSIMRYPASNHTQGSTVKCTYISIPQASQKILLIKLASLKSSQFIFSPHNRSHRHFHRHMNLLQVLV
jgi:dipeptidase